MSFELAWPQRSHRVRFKKAVRVVPLVDGPPRAFRVLSGNLSKQGMFLTMPEPFPEGTQVALSIEAGGRVLPFAQGEVMWRAVSDGALKPGQPCGGAGFGVRFTNFLHPRAHELVDYLVSSLDTGRPLGLPAKKRWRKVAKWGGGLAASLALAGLGVILARQVEVAPLSQIDEQVAVAEAAVETPEAAEAASPEPSVEAMAPEAHPAIEEPAASPLPAAPPEPAPVAAEHEAVPQEPTMVAAQAAAAKPDAPMSSTGLLPLPKCAASSLRWAQRSGRLELEVAAAAGGKFAAAFRMKNPERLVIDLNGASPKRSHVVKATDIPNVSALRIGKRKSGGTRLVLDLSRPVTLKVEGSRLELSY